MKRFLVYGLSALLAVTACQKEKEKVNNPFLEKSSLDQGAPDFSKITAAHFLPAFKAGMEQQKEQIQQIASSKETPTFQNTIIPYEASGEILERTSNVFDLVSEANFTDSINEIKNEVTPLLAEHRNAILYNDALFERIRTVYEQEYTHLKGEDQKLLKEVYEQFKRQGADLSSEKKKELERINTRLAELSREFSDLVTKGTNAAGVWVEAKAELAGLSEAQISQAAADAEKAGGKAAYYLVITNTTQQPLLASLENRTLRKKLYEASIHRTDEGTPYSTAEIIKETVALRAEKAELLGYPNYASWRLQNTMAKTPENVYSFFRKLIQPYLVKSAAETAEIQAFARQKEGRDFELQPYDRFYYSKLMKQQRFELDEKEVAEYFVLDSVLKNGVFYAAEQIYGLRIEPRQDLPTYRDEVKVFNVKDKEGKLLAIFYGDYFRRDNKRGGAWMSSFAKQSFHKQQIPIIYNVCNFPKPAQGQPALLSMGEVETMFHEFGHALHGMLSSCQYNTLSGTAVSRDFVEYPSQFNEYFATVPDVFKNYARHYQTGELMPEDLKAKVMKSSNYHSAYALGENIAAVLIDMAWHMLSLEEAKAVKSVEAFQKEALEREQMFDAQVPARYLSPYFLHVFAGGYAAGYYAYLWSEVLAVNTADLFQAHGGLSTEIAQKYRELILSTGNTKDLAEQFSLLTGLEEPDADSLLKAKGL